MHATEFEFRHRFWFIGGIFWAAFSMYRFDHVNLAQEVGAWVAVHTAWPQVLSIRAVLAFGVAIAVLAAALRTWAASFLRSEVVHDMALRSERLVAEGPYRYVRNPLYLGTILLGLGMGLMASRLGFAVLVFGLTIFVLRLIGREEAELSASQGERYRRYQAAVPCLVPSLFPCVAAGGGNSQWKQAFIGESFIWGFAAAMAGFAVTLKLEVFWIVMVAAFIFYFVSIVVLKKQRAAARM